MLVLWYIEVSACLLSLFDTAFCKLSAQRLVATLFFNFTYICMSVYAKATK